MVHLIKHFSAILCAVTSSLGVACWNWWGFDNRVTVEHLLHWCL